MGRTRRKKKRTHRAEGPGAASAAAAGPGGGAATTAAKEPPRSFVFRRGRNAALVADLAADVRKMMQPHTAVNLKEQKSNRLRDFVHVAGPLGISHFLVLSATERSRYLRIAKAPRGPTLTFRVTEFALCKDVAAVQRRPRDPESAYRSPPLVVLNNFGSEQHMRLATATFQNLFPPINVRTVKLSQCQRVVLVDCDRESGRLSLRHYTISAVPAGVNRRVKRLLVRREAPDLGGLDDVAEYLMRNATDASDSEGEDNAAARVVLAQDVGRTNKAASQSTVKLHEVGPRMELELVKIEEGLCDGLVLYHSHVTKTPEEVEAMESSKQAREALRRQRREEQEANVRRKRAATGAGGAGRGDDADDDDSGGEDDDSEGAGDSGGEASDGDDFGDGEPGGPAGGGGDDDSDDSGGDPEDDDAWYEREVGAPPPPPSHAPAGRKRRRKG